MRSATTDTQTPLAADAAPVTKGADTSPVAPSGMASVTPRNPVPAQRDPYRSVVWVLLAANWIGAFGAYYGAGQLMNPVLYAVSLTLGLAGGILLAVAAAQILRERAVPAGKKAETARETQRFTPETAPEQIPLSPILARIRSLKGLPGAAWNRIRWLVDRMGLPRLTGTITGIVGLLLIVRLMRTDIFAIPVPPTILGIAAGICLVAAGLAATAARYLGAVETERLPESVLLGRLARVVGWILVLAALSMLFAWLSRDNLMFALFFLILVIDGALCIGLFSRKRQYRQTGEVFAPNTGILSVLGSRNNILASILDSAERQMGIDIRSTWALTVVRRSLEPLAIGLCVAGWLSTCLTVVAADEQGLVERLGVPVGRQPLMPGLHLHWPWPIDQVYRAPAQRAQLIEIGHEGEEPGGPENVLWSVEHAPNEYTLLLGNGRDLITVDAAIQFRIKDIRAWRYNTGNPADALKALGYRAVTRDTVDRTLSEALSENIATLTGDMRSRVQRDADALGLGVEVLGFTVGGMHPPVPVARDYEAVVSAELQKVTAVVNAQVYRNQALPSAEAMALTGTSAARAEGATALATAAGEAWSFRTLEAQYHAEPAEYLFRRRLETLEKGLAGRRFTVVDSRFERDGGELWMTP